MMVSVSVILIRVEGIGRAIAAILAIVARRELMLMMIVVYVATCHWSRIATAW